MLALAHNSFVLYVFENALEFLAFLVWFDVFMVLYQHTSSKLDVKGIIDSATDVLFSLIKLSMLDRMVFNITLCTIRILNEIFVVIRLVLSKICGQYRSLLLKDLDELACNHAVRRSSILDHLLHHLKRQIFEPSRQLALRLRLAVLLHARGLL